MKFVLVVFFLMISAPAMAGITFNEGRWQTNFDWEEGWQHDRQAWLDPAPHKSGVQTRGGALEGDYKTTITADANYPGGKGGKGIRFWKASGAQNIHTASMRITFNKRQPELWVRYYFRYEEGFQWVHGACAGTKEIYWNVIAHEEGADAYTGIMDNAIRTVNQGGNRIDGRLVYPANWSFGWNQLYPGGISDGSWHCLEAYMLIDSGENQFDGAGRIWINGKLIAESLNMNWSGGGHSADNGWSWFEFLSNQKDPGLDRPYYQDVSDMVIYNRTPPNFDEHGNPFIGPIGWSDSAKMLFPPINLRFVE